MNHETMSIVDTLREAVDLAILLGYPDGAGLYAKMLVRYVRSCQLAG